MRIISYATWKKSHWGIPMSEGYHLCGDDYGYGLFKSVYPKDAAKFIIDSVFTKEESEGCEFVYIPHPYKGHNSKEDYIEVWYRKEKK